MPKIGYKQTKEHRKKLKKSHSGQFQKGHKTNNGRKQTDKHKEKIRLKLIGNTHGFQKGDKTNKAKFGSKNGMFNKGYLLKGKKNGRYKDGLTKLQKQEKTAGRKKPEQCEICGSMDVISFDHNHETGEFRGWICRRCNRTLGFVKDSPELLRRLATYLEVNK